MQVQPEEGYRLDAIKLDFRSHWGYELDNMRLGAWGPCSPQGVLGARLRRGPH